MEFHIFKSQLKVFLKYIYRPADNYNLLKACNKLHTRGNPTVLSVVLPKPKPNHCQDPSRAII